MASKVHCPPQLVVIEGNEKGKVIPLKNGTVVLGRSKGDIIIQDSRISRSHVALHFDESSGKLTFTDLKSLNGTLINGEVSESGELKDGDKLQMGNTVLDCQIGAVEATVAAKTTQARKEPVVQLNSSFSQNTSLPQEPFIGETDKPASTKTPASPSKTQRLSLPGLRKAYSELRPSSRIALFVLFLALGWFALETPSPSSRSISNADLDKAIAEVRQLESKGKIAEALTRAEQLKKEFSDSSEVFMLLGDMYSALQKLEAAIDTYKRAKDLSPRSRLVHFKLVRVYLKAGLPTLAQEEMRVIDKMIQENPKDRDLIIETAQLLLTHRELNQPVEKVTIIAKALQGEIAPDSPIGYKLEAQVWMQQKRPQDALLVLEKGHKVAPQDEELMETLALAKLSLKDTQGAMSTIDHWLKINPTAIRALLVMSYLKFNDRDFLAAVPHLQKIMRLLGNTPNDPYYAESLHLMGLIYLEQGQKQEAEIFLTKACKLGFQQSCNHPAFQTLQSEQSRSSSSSTTE